MLMLRVGLIIHDVSRRRKVFQVEQAHKGKVSGVCFGQQDRLLSCGVDRNIKLWSTSTSSADEEPEAGPSQVQANHPYAHGLPAHVILAKTRCNIPWKDGAQVCLSLFVSRSLFILRTISSVDHHRYDPLFATASNLVQVWDETK